ncbi:rhombosortase [Paraglaciecola sp. L3A3]|uniref:rhombosortase n=1 Tax=Paraglaciecola sp. L3A3 TaxID=2686358 RepID=UPI001E43F2CB|nr:rhombosortase [Paraglaciecola sp. L3A3]
MPITVIIISCTFWLLEPSSREWFAYNRNLISDGQWWRLISGHFLHTNSNHLWLNLTGLVLLWALNGDYYNIRSVWTLFILCIGTSIGLFFYSDDLIWYVGLSGVLHGLFIIGAWQDIIHKIKSGWILFFGVWLKVIYEQIAGANEEVATLINANVAIDAHLMGTIIGTLIVVFILVKNNLPSFKTNQ